MGSKFSPSVNIIRDLNREIDYIPTPNSKDVFNQLIANYEAGHHCFNIIGAYGTGKSAFLWALEKTLRNKVQYFNVYPGSTFQKQDFQFEYFIGEHSSFIQNLAARYLQYKIDYSVQDVLDVLETYYQELKEQNKILVLVVDEFGKFLEYAAKQSPEQELYFIQQLAEYINDVSKNILLITVLHQDFSAYSLALTRHQKEEWTKVKGRLKELSFNEPVEQLLYLASKKLADLPKNINDLKQDELFKAISKANLFPLRDYFSKSVAKDVYPLDILAAGVLALSLQKYGQNERSLFSFLESDDAYGLSDFRNEEEFYNISHVFDYLAHHYYATLNSKYNPHSSQWSYIRRALDRVENLVETHVEEARKIVKTIGLLKIFASTGGEINKAFLSTYGRLSLGIENPSEILATLEETKIIRFINHAKQYQLFEGTDLDIELAINEAGELIENVTDVVKYVKQYFNQPYIQAKQISYEKGTPRIFEFKITDEPILESPEKEVDGYINLIFSDRLSLDELKTLVATGQKPILYGLYQNTSEIKSLIREIEKIIKVKERHPNDKVALRELDDILVHQIKLLNHYVIGSLYNDDKKITWFFNGRANTQIMDRKNFNRCLSNICEEIYFETPVFKSELVNKTKISGAIAGARKNLLKALTANWEVADLGFPEKNFPPEKSIYLSLLKNTGIHSCQENKYLLSNPTDTSFNNLWQVGINYIESTRVNERKLSELTEIFSTPPLKLKKGFIDFWLPIFLFIKRNEFALFGPTGFISEINSDVLDLIIKEPVKYTVKAFDVEGVRLSFFNQYREFIQKSSVDEPTIKTFIETIKPFLTFFKGLPEYSKKTSKLSIESIRLREVISKAKDPEATFFETMPQALGFSLASMQQNPDLQEEYITTLQSSITELRTAYDKLIERIENFISKEIVGTEPNFVLYKEALQSRYKALNPYQLTIKQKTFVQRVMSALDDRNAWLTSLATALVQKQLTVFDDMDEILFYENFKKQIYQLDCLLDIVNANVDLEREDAFKIEINSFEGGLQQRIVRLPKHKMQEIQITTEQFKITLSEIDNQQAIAILTNLLKERLTNE